MMSLLKNAKTYMKRLESFIWEKNSDNSIIFDFMIIKILT